VGLWSSGMISHSHCGGASSILARSTKVGKMDKNEFKEDDLKTMFEGVEETVNQSTVKVHSPEPQTQHIQSVKKLKSANFKALFLSAFKILAIFISIFIFCFTLLNFPAILIKTKYFVNVESKKTEITVKDPMLSYMQSKNNQLFIPKIDIEAPVIWNVPDNETLPILKNGVAHYLNTALPGQAGNIFISGHSSNYWWEKGDYNQIFVLLDKLEIGDKIYINYGNRIHKYMVTDKKVVNPKNLDVLKQTQNRTLSLMTCVPIGTNLNRLVVTALEVN
jgi:LPXTG-site transpeptidase (sortase) family protein